MVKRRATHLGPDLQQKIHKNSKNSENFENFEKFRKIMKNMKIFKKHHPNQVKNTTFD